MGLGYISVGSMPPTLFLFMASGQSRSRKKRSRRNNQRRYIEEKYQAQEVVTYFINKSFGAELIAKSYKPEICLFRKKIDSNRFQFLIKKDNKIIFDRILNKASQEAWSNFEVLCK